MTPISRLGRQIVEVTEALRKIDATHALIGGLALAPHQVIRATRDIELFGRSALLDELLKETT